MIDFSSLDPETSTAVYDRLPMRIKEFVDLIGLGRTLALIQECAGQDLQFGKGYNQSGHETFAALVEIIGHEAALKLHGEWPNVTVYIPFCRKSMQYLRDKEIIQRYDELTKTISHPKAINQLARQFKIAARTIEIIISRPL